MDLRDVRKHLPIDKHSLDSELERHAMTYYDIGEEMTFAVSRRDQAKEDLARVDAEVYDEIVQSDNEKLSDAKIRNRVLADSRHKDAFTAYNQARAEADQWTVLHEAYRQRGSMLRQLAELYVANYYTTSSTTHASGTADRVEAQKGREALAQARHRGSDDAGSVPVRRRSSAS